MTFDCKCCKKKVEHLERCRECRANYCSVCKRKGACHTKRFCHGQFGQGYSGASLMRPVRYGSSFDNWDEIGIEEWYSHG